jgi:hypothetical protein
VADIRIGDRACATCPLGCGNFTSVNGVQVEGPEYETLCLGGSNCDINDMEQVMRFNRACDDLGLDTMSTGNVIGLAMALTESGAADLGLTFGDAPAYLQVLDEIANGSTPRGRDLALGAARLADKYGQPDQAAHSKGLEMPAYDPRGNYGMGLAYATSERGACHLRAFPLFADDPFKLKDLAKDVVAMQNVNGAKWSMCFCDFWGSVDTTIMADLLTKPDWGARYRPPTWIRSENGSGTWCACSTWRPDLPRPMTPFPKNSPNGPLKTDPTKDGPSAPKPWKHSRVSIIASGGGIKPVGRRRQNCASWDWPI